MVFAAFTCPSLQIRRFKEEPFGPSVDGQTVKVRLIACATYVSPRQHTPFLKAIICALYLYRHCLETLAAPDIFLPNTLRPPCSTHCILLCPPHVGGDPPQDHNWAHGLRQDPDCAPPRRDGRFSLSHGAWARVWVVRMVIRTRQRRSIEAALLLCPVPATMHAGCRLLAWPSSRRFFTGPSTLRAALCLHSTQAMFPNPPLPLVYRAPRAPRTRLPTRSRLRRGTRTALPTPPLAARAGRRLLTTPLHPAWSCPFPPLGRCAHNVRCCAPPKPQTVRVIVQCSSWKESSPTWGTRVVPLDALLSSTAHYFYCSTAFLPRPSPRALPRQPRSGAPSSSTESARRSSTTPPLRSGFPSFGALSLG